LTQTLTVNQDSLTGSAGNDGFTAWIFDNQNTAQSGDYINGGAGTDTLMAEIGQSQNFAISLKTDSVEVAHFRVQESNESAGDNGENDIGGDVQIDAQDMNGTVEFWGVDQRGDLIIEDIQAGSNDVTIGWRDSDPSQVDLEVYFDNITAPGATTAGSQLFLELLDLDAMAATGDPLTNNPYVGVSFTMDGVTVNVPEDAAGAGAVTTTYADLVAGINALLEFQGLTTVTASLGSSFSAINSDNGNSYDGTTIVLTNTGSETLGTGGWILAGQAPADSNLHASQSTVAPTTSTTLTQTNIIFDEVGSGSKGGDFIAGEMSNGGGTSGTAGIQQFDILVQGDSWVTELGSTNNTLEVINIENDSGFTGDLRIDDIGNGANDGDDDVRVIDASSMAGDVTLDIELESTAQAKYFDLTDEANDASSDNVAFAYSTGAGDDMLTLEFAEEVIAHEDATLSISTGAGDDTVTTNFDNDAANDVDTNWLNDQKDLDNASISTGSGDDTVTTTGAGDFNINTGSGDDTVYANNDGNLATARVNEVQTLTFSAAGELNTNGNIVVHGTTVTVNTNDTAATIATNVAAALHNVHADFTAANGGSAIASGSTVIFTFDNNAIDAAGATGGDIASIVVTENIATDATLTYTTNGANGTDSAAATAEVTNVTFGGNEAIGATVIFDGTTITLADSDASGTVELDEVAQQVAAGTYTNFTVTDFDYSGGVVQFTANNGGADQSVVSGLLAANMAAGDITGTNVGVEAFTFAAVGTNVVAGANGVDAVAAVAEGNDVITMTAADFTGTFSITVDSDGDNSLADETAIDVALVAGDSAITVGGKVATALDAALDANFTITDNSDGTVTIAHAAALGDIADLTWTDGAVKAATSIAETTKGVIASNAAAATWVVNATNTALADLDGQATTSSLLSGATVTVTFSGATDAGVSGVTDGASSALTNGFESTITIPTDDNMGDEASINQAIKEAINSDDVLQEFLTAVDGPDNTLIITSMVDGQFAESDLAITLTAATVANLSTSDVSSMKTTLQDINNASGTTYTDTQLQTALDNAVDVYTTSNALDDLAMATDTANELIDGAASATDSDNTIQLGSGDNVVVLGTDATSSDEIVIDSAFGMNSVLNFATTGTGADVLDFAAYLTGMTSASGSTASQVAIAATVSSVTGAGGDSSVTANEVVIINDFTETTTDTFAGLSATVLMNAVNSTNTGTADYANIDAGTLDAATAVTDLVGDTRSHIVMVENEANDGEYKVFHLTSADSNNANNDFSSASLLGTIDFGNELTSFSVANVSIA